MDIKKNFRSNILSNQNEIRLDIFLDQIIYGENGYYIQNKPIGKKNDFITAPEISQMFGEIIGLYLYYFWKTKIKEKYNLIELGPGNGTLFRDIVNSTKNFPEFIELAKIRFIEINNKLLKIQKKNINVLELPNIRWAKSINFRSNIPSIIYSNEFFDCFPVRHFIKKNKWFEKFVSFNKKENIFFFKNKMVKNQKILSILKSYNQNNLAEISFKRNEYFNRICKFIKKNRGLIVTVDYGYSKNIKYFTLQAIQNHKFSNVLDNIGNKDISSHVNFKDLISIAKYNNLKIEEFCTQNEFLLKFGILERFKKISNTNVKKEIRLELDKLINKKQMGSLFKFLIVSNL